MLKLPKHSPKQAENLYHTLASHYTLDSLGPYVTHSSLAAWRPKTHRLLTPHARVPRSPELSLCSHCHHDPRAASIITTGGRTPIGIKLKIAPLPPNRAQWPRTKCGQCQVGPPELIKHKKARPGALFEVTQLGLWILLGPQSEFRFLARARAVFLLKRPGLGRGFRLGVERGRFGI